MNNLEMENTIIQTLDRHDLSECFTPEELALFETLGREEGGPGWTQEKERQLDELNRKLVEWEGDVLDRENDEIIEDFFTLNFFSP